MTPAQVAAARRLAAQGPWPAEDPFAEPEVPSVPPPRTPAGTSAALAPRPRPSARPAAQPARPPLRVVPGPRRRPALRRRRLVALGCCALPLAAMLAAVVGHALLAEGQVRSSRLQAEVVTAQARDAADQMRVARLDTPARVTGVAAGQQLGPPAQVQQVPSVPLGRPVTPKVSPAPTPPAPAASSAANTPAAGR